MENPVLMLGGLCLDRYCLLSQFPVRGQDTLIQDTFERIGGCPINAAFTLKKIRIGPGFIFCSRRGVDRKSQAFFHRNELPADGLFVIEDQKTGFCMILLDDQKERTFMTYRGCEGIFDPARIPALNYRASRLTGLYLICGETVKMPSHICTPSAPTGKYSSIRDLYAIRSIRTCLKKRCAYART